MAACVVGLATLTLGALVASGAAQAAGGQVAATTADVCDAAKGTEICNVSRPEDMAPVPSSDWIIVSGYNPDSLYRIDARTRRVTNLAGSVRVKWDRTAFPDCSAAPPPGGLTAHGLAVTAGTKPTLFVIGHGSREAIEVYKLRRRDAALTWIGCIPVPKGMSANSVAALRSGGLVVTNLGTPGPNVMADIIAGRPTGDVRTWSRKDGWRVLPHSRDSGPNGIALAKDERSVFVAMSGSREVVRLSLDGKAPPVRSAKLDIMPDNLRWTAEGTLLTTGMRFDADANLRCFGTPGCRPPFDVYEVDVKTLTATSLSGRFEARSMPLTTTALRVGNDVWVSSIGGQSIAVFPLKP